MKQGRFFFFGLLIFLNACIQNKSGGDALPVLLDDGWPISTPIEEGFDEQRLMKALKDIPANNAKLDAVVVVRNGRLVAEEYFNGYAPQKLHKLWSITKMVSGTLIGIATDKELININDNIGPYLENYGVDNASITYGITIEHLITMTSGYEWSEMGGPHSAGFQLPYSNNWIEFILNQPRNHAPGEVFNYSSGNTLLLAPIMKNATGKQARDFAEKHLFQPLGISKYEWDAQGEFWTKTAGNELPGAKVPEKIAYQKPFDELTNTATGLHMRPRDLAKIGQVYLNDGMWNDRKVFGEEWIRESTQPHFGNTNYGYHWRLMTFQDEACYYATGFGLQRMYVFPGLDLVIVLMQQHYTTMPEGKQQTDKLLEEVIDCIEK